MIDLDNIPFFISGSNSFTVIIILEENKKEIHFLNYHYNWLFSKFILEEMDEDHAAGTHPLEYAEYKMQGTLYNFSFC